MRVAKAERARDHDVNADSAQQRALSNAVRAGDKGARASKVQTQL